MLHPDQSVASGPPARIGIKLLSLAEAVALLRLCASPRAIKIAGELMRGAPQTFPGVSWESYYKLALLGLAEVDPAGGGALTLTPKGAHWARTISGD